MADSAGVLFESLLAIMSRLRGDGGCPWDREQTRESLKPYLIEEAYEALDAIDRGKPDAIVEELGDVLFQVVFHAQVASEQGEFTMATLLRRLNDKMVRRHPHVFADGAVADASDALAQWERIKQDERRAGGTPGSALDGVPGTLPALLRAQRLQAKAGRVGFDWAQWSLAWAKVRGDRRADQCVAAGDDRRVLGLGPTVLDRQCRAPARGRCGGLAEAGGREVHPTIQEVEADMRAEGGRCATHRRKTSTSGGSEPARESVDRPGGRPASGGGHSLVVATKAKVAPRSYRSRAVTSPRPRWTIVNAASAELSMGAGVAGAMKRKGGIVIEEDAIPRADRGRRGCYGGRQPARDPRDHAATMARTTAGPRGSPPPNPA